MAKIPAYSFSHYVECPHQGLHGNHITADHRTIGICMMADSHLTATLILLNKMLDEEYSLVATRFAHISQSFHSISASNFYDADLADIEHKIELLEAEQHRRQLNKALK